MHTPHAKRESPDPAVVVPPGSQPATEVPLVGIEKIMADALIALDREPARAMPTAGETEYASWVRLLRRPTP
jgi:hypothetical protein